MLPDTPYFITSFTRARGIYLSRDRERRRVLPLNVLNNISSGRAIDPRTRLVCDNIMCRCRQTISSRRERAHSDRIIRVNCQIMYLKLSYISLDSMNQHCQRCIVTSLIKYSVSFYFLKYGGVRWLPLEINTCITCVATLSYLRRSKQN